MTTIPDPILISSQTARRFLLNHHFLLPPRQLEPEDIVPVIFNRLGCIQFDTINVVGRNADLVLQSRVNGYTSDILKKLLYEDRTLIDGWDKVASIYQTTDWPHFSRRRALMKQTFQNRSDEAAEAAPGILAAIKENGPMSSIDFKDDRKTDWWWAPTSVSRAAMEYLYASGDLGIYNRVNTRRVFDLIERLVPEHILAAPAPHAADKDFTAWHIHRRIGSQGIATMESGEQWGGIIGGRKAAERRAVIYKLLQEGRLVRIKTENLPKKDLFIRQEDLHTFNALPEGQLENCKAAFIAPLDNLIWNRRLISDLFDFSYTWEVYKPQRSRQYGYYVLPVLYQDRFIARVDMKLDSKTNILHLINWWWEEGVFLTPEMETATSQAFSDFLHYLGGNKIELVRQNFIAKRQASLFESLIGDCR